MLYKRDAQSGVPLAGAVYALYHNGKPLASAVSDVSGLLSFSNLPAGEYELVEITPPTGYKCDTTRRRLVVADDGTATLDGHDAEGAVLYDTRINASLSFLKTDHASGAPLSGATFTLSDSRTATSDADGIVDFGTLSPGTYTMRETTAPDGYELVSTVFTVVVDVNGCIVVNGVPASQFTVANTPQANRSERPVIQSVTEGDRVINGTGIPGATITVTLPDGTQVTTVVDATGSWSVNVPQGAELHANETIYASQTVPGEAPSENASFLVQASN